MTEEQHCQSTDFRSAGRRDPVRKGVKTTYIAPAVLAAVETTDRPVVARFTGS